MQALKRSAEEHGRSSCRRWRRTRPGSTTLLADGRKRRENETARAAARGVAPRPGHSPPRTSGKLDWPVQGTIVYKFGRDTLPSGGVIRWNGIGIGAPVGTPVKAVEGGRVGLVGNVGHLRTDGGRRARQRLLVALHAAAERAREAGRQGGAGAGGRDGGRRPTPTTVRTCTSRSGGRTRSRSIRRPGCDGAETRTYNWWLVLVEISLRNFQGDLSRDPRARRLGGISAGCLRL